MRPLKALGPPAPVCVSQRLPDRPLRPRAGPGEVPTSPRGAPTLQAAWPTAFWGGPLQPQAGLASPARVTQDPHRTPVSEGLESGSQGPQTGAPHPLHPCRWRGQWPCLPPLRPGWSGLWHTDLEESGLSQTRGSTAGREGGPDGPLGPAASSPVTSPHPASPAQACSKRQDPGDSLAPPHLKTWSPSPHSQTGVDRPLRGWAGLGTDAWPQPPRPQRTSMTWTEVSDCWSAGSRLPLPCLQRPQAGPRGRAHTVQLSPPQVPCWGHGSPRRQHRPRLATVLPPGALCSSEQSLTWGSSLDPSSSGPRLVCSFR
uniref:nascent polypeptide-associated complex subunit alpha, muscle-specific form-like n=1 Tax=Halichoerus grypus TaxID=9711 RepID=UPI001658D3C3|nr:nascent polypeptide-associated complex subunit alpha, muscle-specific form-like [Halichoerus grypus]XP_035973504.1 nascent polypeptide-associated complex subunit alpha, muscle-specific form-like [Halichoerus grypus]XP_035973505.1 nascent polypeptide-associated complex subunit alpha, muscle-specific form-like [Halichoerus grypus]XP_035973506.1 nascent polypeptide-associated complex subunit alpha, muscle-specific form-like [Halichoerus grypus]XP_035973507.1 nascent polypeptide-associated compl